MRPSALALLVFLFSFPIPGVSRGPSQTGEELQILAQQAAEAQDRHDYAAAARNYLAMLEIDPDSPKIRANLGLMDYLLGKYTDAAQNFKDVLCKAPTLLAPNLFLGIDLLRLYHPREALLYLTRADRLSPHNLQVNLSLGRAYAALGRFNDANEYYYRATKMKPQNADALYGLGVTYLSIQRSAVQKLAETGKHSVYAQMLLAESFAHEGRAADSRRILQKLLASQPDFAGLHAALGFDDAREGNLAQAGKEFQAELRAHPGYLKARLGLVRVALQKRNSLSAANPLELVWQTDSNFARANFAQLDASPDARETALLKDRLLTLAPHLSPPDLQRFVMSALSNSSGQTPISTPGVSRQHLQYDEYPASPPPSSGTISAWRLYAEGRYTACAQELWGRKNHLDRSGLRLLTRCSFYSGYYQASFLATRKLLDQGPAAPEALFWRAKACMRLSHQALYVLGSAHPDSYQVHLLLGRTYLNMNRFSQSVAEYQRALEVKPGGLAAHLGLAAAYWKNMEFDQALPQLKDVLGANPKDPQASYMLGEILVERHQYADAHPLLVTATRGGGQEATEAHALLGKVDAAEGKNSEAIQELKQALGADHDGSLHFQLYQLYQRVGDQWAARSALEKSEVLRRQEEQNAQSEVQVNH